MHAALGLVREENRNMPSYQRTNKAGCSGDGFRFTAVFFAFAVVALTIVAVSVRLEPSQLRRCYSGEGNDCHEHTTDVIIGIMIATMVSALLSLVFLYVTLRIFRQREASTENQHLHQRFLPACSRTRIAGFMFYGLGLVLFFVGMSIAPRSGTDSLDAKLGRRRSMLEHSPVAGRPLPRRAAYEAQHVPVGNAAPPTIPDVPSRGRKLSGPQVRSRESSVEAGQWFTPLVLHDGAWYPICRFGFERNSFGATQVCQALGFAFGVPLPSTQENDPGTEKAMPVGECSDGQDIDKCEFQGINRWGKMNDTLCDFPRELGPGNVAKIACASSLGDSCGDKSFIVECGDRGRCCRSCHRQNCNEGFYFDEAKCSAGSNVCQPCSLVQNASLICGIEECRSLCHKMRCEEDAAGGDCINNNLPNDKVIRSIALFAGVAYLVGFALIWKDLGRWRELFETPRSQTVPRDKENGAEVASVYNEVDVGYATLFEYTGIFCCVGAFACTIACFALGLRDECSNCVDENEEKTYEKCITESDDNCVFYLRFYKLATMDALLIAVIMSSLFSLGFLVAYQHVLRHKGKICNGRRLAGFIFFVIGLILCVVAVHFVDDLSKIVMTQGDAYKALSEKSRVGRRLKSVPELANNNGYKMSQAHVSDLSRSTSGLLVGSGRKLTAGNGTGNANGTQVRGRGFYAVKPGVQFVPEVLFNGSWYPICPDGFTDNWYGATKICENLGLAIGVSSKEWKEGDNLLMPVGKCEDGQDLDKCEFNGIRRWGEINSGLCSTSNEFVKMVCFSELDSACKGKDYSYLSDCEENGETLKCCCPDEFTCGENMIYRKDHCGSQNVPQKACRPCPLSRNAEYAKPGEENSKHKEDGDAINTCGQRCKSGFNFFMKEEYPVIGGYDVICVADNIVPDEGIISSIIIVAGLATTAGFLLIRNSLAHEKKWMLSQIKDDKKKVSPTQSPPPEKVREASSEGDNLSKSENKPSSDSGLITKLKELKIAKDAGLLSETEFESAKQQLLSSFTGVKRQTGAPVKASTPKQTLSYGVQNSNILAPPPNTQNLIYIEKPILGVVTTNFAGPNLGVQTSLQKNSTI